MPPINIKKIPYKGWKNAVEISNIEIKIVVVPEVGRILHYSFIHEDNVFYENEELFGATFKTGEYFNKNGIIEAPNIGGNRVLPCSEDYFEILTGSRHIPDPFINASAYECICLKNGIVLLSPVSELLGIQIKRTITICETGTMVNIEQELIKKIPAKNNKLDQIPLTIWSLSKIKTPNTAFFLIYKNSVFNNGYIVPVWPDSKNNAATNIAIKNNMLELKSTKNLPQKVGADSKKWVAAYIQNSLFIEQFHFNEHQKNNYPDNGTSVTIFGNELFSELECLSPEKNLQIGENIHYNLQWNLYKIRSKKEVVAILNSL